MSEREVGERVREKMKKQTRLACTQLTNCFVCQKTQPKLSHCYLLVISGPLYSTISLYPQTLLQKQWHQLASTLAHASDATQGSSLPGELFRFTTRTISVIFISLWLLRQIRTL